MKTKDSQTLVAVAKNFPPVFMLLVQLLSKYILYCIITDNWNASFSIKVYHCYVVFLTAVLLLFLAEVLWTKSKCSVTSTIIVQCQFNIVIANIQNEAVVYHTYWISLTNIIFDFSFCDCATFFFMNVS